MFLTVSVSQLFIKIDPVGQRIVIKYLQKNDMTTTKKKSRQCGSYRGSLHFLTKYSNAGIDILNAETFPMETVCFLNMVAQIYQQKCERLPKQATKIACLGITVAIWWPMEMLLHLVPLYLCNITCNDANIWAENHSNSNMLRVFGAHNKGAATVLDGRSGLRKSHG